MSPPRTPVQLAFARAYATWGLHVPDVVAAARADGHLSGAGWMVRWRWHPDGSLEYRASHRMTDERWTLLAPDGTETPQAVPFSFMVFPKDADSEQRADVKRAHGEAWSAHRRRVVERGMAFDTGYEGLTDEHRGADRMVWRTDGGSWTSSLRL